MQTTHYYKSDFYNVPIEVININGEVLVIITDTIWRRIIYTWYDIVNKNTDSWYINQCLLGGFIHCIPQKVLIIWFGWWAFAKYLEDHIMNVHITGIDIDPIMFEIAQKELWIQTQDFYIKDAIVALDEVIKEKKMFDLVLVDVYWWDWEIPDFFVDTWIFEKIKKTLNPDGIVSVNYADYDQKNMRKFEKYTRIHESLISTFGDHYSHLLSKKNERWNIVWIYNLKKEQSVRDYIKNYMWAVHIWDIIFDPKIITKIFLDNDTWGLQYNILSKKTEVHHCITTVKWWKSHWVYGSYNIALHVWDETKNVLYNRAILSEKMWVTSDRCIFMNQIHWDTIVTVDNSNYQRKLNCDAMITNNKNFTLCVMVADCVPILLFDTVKKVVAVVHAGWKWSSLAIVKKTLSGMQDKFWTQFKDVIAGIWPCISKKNYEVTSDVYNKFDKKFYSKTWDTALLDLLSVNKEQLLEQWVLPNNIDINSLCTKEHTSLFFSARRDGVKSGRFCVSVKLV